MRDVSYLFRIVVTLVGAIALAACSVGGVYPPKSGQVLDWQTKKPIAGAIVVATWQGYVPAIVERQHECYHVETATADEQGRFRIPFHAEGPSILIDTYRQYSAYKAGYRVTIDERGRLRGNYEKDGVLYLQRDQRSIDERIDFLFKILGTSDCGTGEGRKNLYPLYISLYEEARSIARTDEQSKKADGLKTWADAIREGRDSGGPMILKNR